MRNIFHINPIIVKEIRSRMRGPRAFITLTVILALMGGLMYAMLQIILANSRYSSVLSPQVGQALFAALAFLELFMICAITPAVTSGAISSEKEKQTYEMLMSTPLSPASVLWGKLISALSYVFLLLFAGVPLASIVFIFGGVALSDMLKALMVLLLFAAAFGILGIFYSALFGRTGRATIASFITVVLLMVGPRFLAGLVAVIRNGEPPPGLLAPSPISALSAALASSMGQSAGGSIFSVLSGIFNMGVSPVSQTSIPRPIYHYTIPFYVLLSLILYLLATRLVQPTRRWRIPRREMIFGIGSVVLLIGLIAAAYFTTATRYEWAVNPNLQQGPGGTQVMVQPAIAVPMGGGVIQQQQVLVQPVDAATATPLPTETPLPAPTIEKTTAPGAASAVLVDEVAQAEIYADIARQLFTVDNTFGGKSPGWNELYLVSTTDDSVGDPNVQKDPPANLPETITGPATKKLVADLAASSISVNVHWIETRDKAPMDAKNGTVANGKGAMITFGNVHFMKDGTAHVSASLYFASLGGTGKTYILMKVDGVWKITGTTGVEWIS